MRLDGKNFSHHDIMNVLSQLFDGFHFGAGHGHIFAEALGNHFDFDIIGKPFQRQTHKANLLRFSELVEKPHIVLKQQAHVRDVIPQHGDPLQP